MPRSSRTAVRGVQTPFARGCGAPSQVCGPWGERSSFHEEDAPTCRYLNDLLRHLAISTASIGLTALAYEAFVATPGSDLERRSSRASTCFGSLLGRNAAGSGPLNVAPGSDRGVVILLFARGLPLPTSSSSVWPPASRQGRLEAASSDASMHSSPATTIPFRISGIGTDTPVVQPGAREHASASDLRGRC